MSFADVSAKIAGTSLTLMGSIAAADWFSVEMTVPIFGVDVVVIAAASLGAVLSLALGDPIRPRTLLFSQTLFATFLGASGSALAANWFGWEAALKMPGPFAFVCAAVARLFLPFVYERGKRFIQEFNFSFTKKDGEP